MKGNSSHPFEGGVLEGEMGSFVWKVSRDLGYKTDCDRFLSGAFACEVTHSAVMR